MMKKILFIVSLLISFFGFLYLLLGDFYLGIGLLLIPQLVMVPAVLSSNQRLKIVRIWGLGISAIVVTYIIVLIILNIYDFNMEGMIFLLIINATIAISFAIAVISSLIKLMGKMDWMEKSWFPIFLVPICLLATYLMWKYGPNVSDWIF